jgi:hypothetical protein
VLVEETFEDVDGAAERVAVSNLVARPEVAVVESTARLVVDDDEVVEWPTALSGVAALTAGSALTAFETVGWTALVTADKGLADATP